MAIGIVGASIVGLTGCANTHEKARMSLPAPIAIDTTQVAGRRVDIPLGNSAYLIVADGSEPEYRASVTGSSVRFTPGSITEDLVLRPGLTTVGPGESTVLLTNLRDGAATQFIVHVE